MEEVSFETNELELTITIFVSLVRLRAPKAATDKS
jgi:hypothetical protein